MHLRLAQEELIERLSINLQAERLRNAKHQVEARFRVEKLHQIADEIEKAGGAKYSTVFLEKEIRKMEKTKKAPEKAGSGDMSDFGQDLQE